MFGSLVAFFSSLIRPPPSVVDCFGYRTRRRLARYMAEEGEKPTVTELLVRMDCNGCVQRIKRALHNIDGVYEVYTDIAQQKLRVVGRADPERIVKAIKRTRKIATVCSHMDPAEPAPLVNEPPSGEAPAPEPVPPAEAPPAIEPPKEAPLVEEAKLEMNNMVPEVRMVHEYPQDYGHKDYWSSDPYYHGANGMMHYETHHNHATHSYSSYRPPTYTSDFQGYTRSPLQEGRHVVPAYGNEYYYRRDRTDGQITSAFSDENPNACTIV